MRYLRPIVPVQFLYHLLDENRGRSVVIKSLRFFGLIEVRLGGAEVKSMLCQLLVELLILPCLLLELLHFFIP